MKLQLKLGWS